MRFRRFKRGLGWGLTALSIFKPNAANKALKEIRRARQIAEAQEAIGTSQATEIEKEFTELLRVLKTHPK